MKTINVKMILTMLAIIAGTGAAFAQRPGRLSGERWEIVEVNGRRTVGANAFLELNNAHTRFTGNTGCNQMSGRVTLQGRRIDFSNVATTRRACLDNRANRQERELVSALERVRQFRERGDTLELLDRGRVLIELTARGRRQPPDTGNRWRLDDNRWVLESIGNQRNIRALPRAFVRFDAAKKSVGGDTSCNVFGGNYTETGSRLRITNVISTMRACVEDDKMQVERAMLDGLRTADRFTIDQGVLQLFRGQRLLLTFRGEAN
jgi:heat shock protein HslJ